MKVSKKNLAKTVSLAVMMATTVSVAGAAELTTGTYDTAFPSGGYTLATDDVTVTSTAQGWVFNDADITLGEGQKLTIVSKEVTGAWLSSFYNSDVNAVGQNNGTFVLQKEGVGTALSAKYTNNAIYVDKFIATAEDGFGINAEMGTITIDAKEITVESGNKAEAPSNTVYAMAGGTINLQNFDMLKVTSKNTSGNPKEGGMGFAANGGTINVKGAENSTVTVSSEGRSAAVASFGGTLTIETGSFEATASKIGEENANRTEIRYTSVIGAEDVSTLTIKAEDVSISGDATMKNAIGAQTSGTIVINSEGTTQVDGNISALSGGSVTVGFDGEDSYLKGNVHNGDALNPGTTNLTFSDGATWTNTGNSGVTNLTSNGGVIDLGDGTSVAVGTLTGSDLTIKADSVDASFIVTDNDSTTQISIDAGTGVMNEYENGDFDDWQDVVDIVVPTDNVTDITIAEGLVLGEVTADVVDGKVTNIVTKENKANAGMIDMTALSLVTWRDSFDDLNSRLGDLRNNREDNGVWARFSRGETSYNSVTNQANMYQIGYDKQAGDWTVGLAYSYTDGNSTFADGSGENTHNVVSLYGTKMNANGTYLDLVAKYGNLDYEYDVRHSGEVAPQGADYDVDAYAFSAEVGKRITSSNGAWVEPQFQLTYGTVDSATFTANNLKIHQNSVDSFVARAGIMAGKPFAKGDIYLRASYLYDFDGEVDGTFSNGKVSTNINRDLGGGWWEVGVGMRTNLSDATHLYLDFEKAFAGEVDTDWKWNAGVRYSF